jgi:hypothetical protein
MKTIHKTNEDLKHAGMQLIMKEILFAENWLLIFQNVDQADKQTQGTSYCQHGYSFAKTQKGLRFGYPEIVGIEV